jgi:hypothetical protein
MRELWARASFRLHGHSGAVQSTEPEMTMRLRAFSSEVDTGSREENASKQKSRASVLIQSEPEML